MHGRAVKEYTGVDFMSFFSDEDAVNAAKRIGVELPESLPGEIFCTPVLIRRLRTGLSIGVHHQTSRGVSRLPKGAVATTGGLPTATSCLLRGSEMAPTHFPKLNDPSTQRARFMRQAALRAAARTREAICLTWDFVSALEYGMPHDGKERDRYRRLV
jgi:lysyl-tRNA synthetase class 2